MGCLFFLLAGIAFMPLAGIPWLARITEESSRKERCYFWAAAVVLACLFGSSFILCWFTQYRNQTAGMVELPLGALLVGPPVFVVAGIAIFAVSRVASGWPALTLLAIASGAALASPLLPPLLFLFSELFCKMLGIELKP